jgi:hypothetical protein
LKKTGEKKPKGIEVKIQEVTGKGGEGVGLSKCSP